LEDGELNPKVTGSQRERRVRMAGRQAQIITTEISMKLQIEGIALSPEHT
jgi:hypothetical protein